MAKLETEFQVSEDSAKLNLAMTAASLGMWDWDAATDRITLTGTAAEIFDTGSGKPLMRSDLRLLLHEADQPRAVAENERAMKEHRDYDIEYRVNMRDGRQVWVATKGRAQYDSAGKIVRMLGVIQDITDRKQAEAERERLVNELRNERAILSEVFNKSPAFMTILRGPRHIFEFVNERYYQLVGNRELLGKAAREALPEIDGQGYFEVLDRVYQTGEPFVGRSVRAMIGAGETQQEAVMDLVYQPLRDGEGNITGIFAHGVDLTEHKIAEEALRVSQRRLRSLVESNIIGVFISDEEMILEANEAYLHIIGYSQAEVEAGKLPWRAVTAPEYQKLEEEALEEALAKGACTPFEKECVRKDGTRVPVLLLIASLDEGKRKFICLAQDLTRQRQAERERSDSLEKERAARNEAERASRMKDEFLATLSHELRTPLNAILGWSQILRSGKHDSEELAEGLTIIERNARAQTQIIEDLLDMSRIISGKVRMELHQIELGDVVSAAIATIRPAAETKGIRLQAVLQTVGHPVKGDANRLQQVFWNLLTNAVKFTPRGGRVGVRIERVSSHVEVSINDTGEGIAVEFLPFVFDRFRQADASTTRRFGGLGLGLSIVKQLVELHGGSISVKSPGIGKGATFTVALGLAAVHPDPETVSAEQRSLGQAGVGRNVWEQLTGVRVLVVDDEADARMLVKRLLEDCDAVVTAAGSVSEAIARLGEHQFDVVVSDIGMPGEDGYALMEKLRDVPIESNRTVPAIALTAYARTEDRVKSIVAGFQMHVAKPIEPAELIAMVASLAKRKL